MRNSLRENPVPPEGERRLVANQQLAYNNLQPPAPTQTVRVETKEKKSIGGRIVRGLLYTAGGVVALALAAPWIERFFAGQVLNRINAGFGAARPGGNLGTSPAPIFGPNPGNSNRNLLET